MAKCMWSHLFESCQMTIFDHDIIDSMCRQWLATLAYEERLQLTYGTNLQVIMDGTTDFCIEWDEARLIPLATSNVNLARPLTEHEISKLHCCQFSCP